MQFQIESFFNPHLSIGADRIDAVLTVAGSHQDGISRHEGAAVKGTDRAIAFIIDRSGSMGGEGRMAAAKRAARVCINLLDDAAQFCVVAFNHEPHVVVPLSAATRANKDRAHREIQHLSANGGTVFSEALLAARDELARLGAGIRYALFLTDGENNAEDKRQLAAAVERCKGLFQCDGRGVGTDWTKADLTFIANTLLGNADIIPDPEMMETAFKDAITAALAKGVADVRLRLWTPKTVTIATIKQVSPEIVDLAPLKIRKDDKTVEIPTGAWADESRDYHLTLTFAPGDIGDEILACRPSVIYANDGQEVVVAARTPVVATWTSDMTLATRISPQVAHYTGQQELADSIREGLAARERGDIDEATRLLGNAAKIAETSGNEEVTRRLKHVVDIVDAPQGTVRLKTAVTKADEMVLDMGGTRTVKRKVS
ncbi:MAG TPA: VWA domain-containing protein [Xanthobacteraceae bacterium]|nr:VWA domain-containing protein [Xanthobacteraceae bacterium]